MDRWKGRVAIVTGAGAGIGAAITKILLAAGMKVVGCGRRINKLEELAISLGSFSGKFFPRQCNIEIESEIRDLFSWIESNEELGNVDVCINNAGMSTAENLLDGTYENWSKMISINVLGLCLCTQLSIKSMQKNNIDDGHVIMINSISGHRVAPNPSTRFYAATKHAVTALVEGWRQEVRDIKSNIRVSALSPGLVATEFQQAMYPDNPEKAKAITSQYKCLEAEDMAKCVEFILGSPVHMQVHDIIVRPTAQPF